MTEEEKRLQELESENQKLREEIERLRPSFKKRIKKGFKRGKLITEAYLGRGLKNSIQKFLTELTEQRTISKDTVSDLSARLVMRFTRLGRIGFLLALIPILFTLFQTWLLFNQNEMIKQQNLLFQNQNILVENQNKRLDQQTYLIEAQRRSALVFLMGNIFDEVNNELREDYGNDGIRNLSPQLIGRIVALSHSLTPYRFLIGDSLTDKEYSPERGQLLITLVNSSIDTTSLDIIYAYAFFTSAYLVDADLSETYLRNADLSDANLSGAFLLYANLSKASLIGANLHDANLTEANLSEAILAGADLSYAKLKNTSLNKSNLNETYLSYADISEVDLQNAHITKQTRIDKSVFKEYRKQFYKYDERFNDTIFELIKK